MVDLGRGGTGGGFLVLCIWSYKIILVILLKKFDLEKDKFVQKNKKERKEIIWGSERLKNLT